MLLVELPLRHGQLFSSFFVKCMLLYFGWKVLETSVSQDFVIHVRASRCRKKTSRKWHLRHANCLLTIRRLVKMLEIPNLFLFFSRAKKVYKQELVESAGFLALAFFKIALFL